MNDGRRAERASGPLAAVMIATLPPAIAAGLVATMVEGFAGRVVSAGAALFVTLTFLAGILAGLRIRGLRAGVMLLGIATAMAIGVAAVPGAAGAFREGAGSWLAAGLFGDLAGRAIAAVVPAAWLLILAAGAPWGWLRVASRVAAALVVGVALVAMPAAVERLSRYAVAHTWPAALEAVGTQAPDLTLVDVDGNERSLAEFRGKLVLVNVWRTW